MNNKLQINQTALILCAVSFLSSVASFSLSAFVGLWIVPMLLLCICSGCFAMTVLCAKTKLYYLVIPAGALCAFFLTFSAYLTIISLLPYLTAIIISVAVRKKTAKLETVVFCDLAGLAVMAVAIVAQFVFTATGKFTFSLLADEFNALFDSAGTMMKQILSQSGVYALYAKLYDLSSITEEQFIADIVNEFIFVAKAISPSVIIVLMGIFSYLSVLSFTAAAKIAGMDFVIPSKPWIIVPSNISCRIFTVAVLLYCVMSIFDSTSIVILIEMVTLNLMIILLLPMLACGIRSIIGRMKSPLTRPRTIFILVVSAIMLVLNFAYGLVFIALQGACDMIVYYKRVKIWEKNNKEE